MTPFVKNKKYPKAVAGWDGHTCLLARFVSAQDPMFPPGETTSIAVNTEKINNIAWKNLNIVDNIANPGHGFIARNVKDMPANLDLVFDDEPTGLGDTVGSRRRT